MRIALNELLKRLPENSKIELNAEIRLIAIHLLVPTDGAGTLSADCAHRAGGSFYGGRSKL